MRGIGWKMALNIVQNETEPDKKWKYGDKCFTRRKNTMEKTFPIFCDDGHEPGSNHLTQI